MALREILKMGDARLLRVAQPVTAFDSDELHLLVRDMFDTMHAANGAGLAAPQIGVDLQLVIYEVFPLICPHCFGPMRIIAFITFSADIHKILEHIGVDSVAPRIIPARGPPLWDDCGAQEPGEGVDAMPDWDMTNQSQPDYPEDQRTVW